MDRGFKFHEGLLSVHRCQTMRIVVFAVLLPLVPWVVNADVVVLKNGDRVTGRIIKMEERLLEIDSKIASEIIKIKWEEVQSVTTDRPMSIKLYGEASLPENVGERVRDRIIQLYTLKEGGPIPLEDVRNINLAGEDYYGNVSIGGNQTSGNTRTQALNLSATLSYRKLEHRIVLDARYNRAQASGRDTANNGALGLRYDYFLSRRLYTGALNYLETDQFQNLSVRDTAVMVLGYDLLDKEHHYLTVGAGPAVVYQDFTTDPDTLTPSAAWLARYEWRYRGDNIIVYHKHQGFKDLGHGSAIRVNAEQGIRIKITGNWRVNLEYDLRYNSFLSKINRKTTDTNIIGGISYDIKP